MLLALPCPPPHSHCHQAADQPRSAATNTTARKDKTHPQTNKQTTTTPQQLKKAKDCSRRRRSRKEEQQQQQQQELF
jgi:hypothetical protein